MKKLITILVLLAVIASTIPVFAQGGEDPNDTKLASGQGKKIENSVFIVQMLDLPVVAYEGGIRGLPATKPGKGQKIDPNDPKVIRYVDYLDGKHEEALNAVGGGNKLYDYHYTYNGFAAQINLDQANALKSIPGVLAVTPDEMVFADTSSTPAFLGLTGESGFWQTTGATGEDVIIGVVDSGIWPEHPSFSDRTGSNPNGKSGKLDYHQIPGWHGKCVPGEEFNASDCSQKLIGAQYFNAAWEPNGGIDALRPWEFNSPRDYNSHGTHTASTSGGNYGVMPTGAASAFGPISGMAPRARIAVYKALWSLEDGSQASGFTSDLTEAIDQAVADGVDVINYSISGTTSNFLDPVQVAFLFAADAGVFVSAAAGNTGPTTATVNHPSPWLTTVAAGTHNRNGEGSVTLGNGATYNGASVANAVASSPLVDSVNVGVGGADPTEVELCYPGTLDPALVAGKIVLCKRGIIARIDKSRAVLIAGGVGMVMYNSPDSSLNADFHFVPTVHVDMASGLAIKAYITSAGSSATAAINQSTIVYNAPAPFTASFSSRGPSRAANGDVLKPDVILPGVDVLAGVSPVLNGREFDMLSGTSMATPHVAGIAALMKELHPDWSVMMIKSALMTSAGDVLDGPNTNPLVIFRQGAGHVQPLAAADPGLVFDSGFLDWLAFLCGTTTGVSPSTCTSLASMGYSFDPSDVNVASIAIGDLAGSQTVTRRVTNVGDSQATYTASVVGMGGISVIVNPSSLALAPGETESFEVTFSTTTAPLNAYAGGQLTWSDGEHQVRVPLVVKPVPLAAPASVQGDGSPISYNVVFGYTGPFTASARGLIPATTFIDSIQDDPGDNFVRGGPGTLSFNVLVPAGTTYTRFSLFNANVSPASDLDLYVYNSANVLVGSSGGGTSEEEINLLNPPADTYTVWVHGFAVPGSADFTLFTWVLGNAASGNMSVSAPASAVSGTSGEISLAFTGLTAGIKYLGSVAYSGAAGMPNPTIVRVDP